MKIIERKFRFSYRLYRKSLFPADISPRKSYLARPCSLTSSAAMNFLQCLILVYVVLISGATYGIYVQILGMDKRDL